MIERNTDETEPQRGRCHRRRLRLLQTLLALAALSALEQASAQPGALPDKSERGSARYAPLVGSGDQLRIRAGVLEEVPEQMQFLLSGGVRMEGLHWRLEGARARIEGPLRRPSAVWLYGTDQAPARFWMRPRDSATITLNRATAMLFAEGQSLRYQALPERLIVRGNALLEEEGSALRGDRLVYDLEQEALRAEGDGGVRLRLEPP